MTHTDPHMSIAEVEVKKYWPEAVLLSTQTGRYQAYITIHGDWGDSRQQAWESLLHKLAGRGSS